MNIWLLLLSLLNVILLAGLSFSLFLRIKEKKEDQRLTRGLQLLQNKISILEDLSDRTDEQVRKLVHVIDQKATEVRNQLVVADQIIDQVNLSISKALDISKIFNEQVPQQEKLNRQKTSAYVQAAKMAHQGFSIEQISTKIDLSPAEVEMITKVNRENLQFSEENLPTWIDEQSASTHNNQDNDLKLFTDALNHQNQKTVGQSVRGTAFDSIDQDLAAQNNLRDEFNKLVTPSPKKEASKDTLNELSKSSVPQSFIDKNFSDKIITANGSSKEKFIRPVQFPKITSHRN
jgi:hypothetical protein